MFVAARRDVAALESKPRNSRRASEGDGCSSAGDVGAHSGQPLPPRSPCAAPFHVAAALPLDDRLPLEHESCILIVGVRLHTSSPRACSTSADFTPAQVSVTALVRHSPARHGIFNSAAMVRYADVATWSARRWSAVRASRSRIGGSRWGQAGSPRVVDWTQDDR